MSIVVVMSLTAGLAFAVASLSGLAGIVVGGFARTVSVGIAAGILLAIAFAEMFPKALEEIGHERAVWAFVAGFLALFIIEVITKGHVHHHGGDPHHEATADGQCERDHGEVHSHRMLPFVIGLALHNLTDGFAIGASDHLSHDISLGVTAGVLVHQIPVGISVAAVLAASHASRRFVLRTALGLGLAIPIGALAVLAVPGASEVSAATLVAAAAGALTYIGAGHLLPEAHNEEHTWGVGVAFPAAFVGTVALFLMVIPHHG